VAFSARQHVEFFHLVFLRALVARGEDKGLFALRGGSNLRFFFRSVATPRTSTSTSSTSQRARSRRRSIVSFNHRPSSRPSERGIELVEVSAPKQTDTTQRWKAGLRAPAFPVPLRTKIEFSRRDRIEGATFEVIEGDWKASQNAVVSRLKALR
jgi:hypothetical protein